MTDPKHARAAVIRALARLARNYHLFEDQEDQVLHIVDDARKAVDLLFTLATKEPTK